MKLGACPDHAGYQLKEQAKERLAAMQIECVDYGTHSEERCDYPDYAHQLVFVTQMGMVDRGIAICGMGNGMATMLNKYDVIRAGLAWSEDIAKPIHAYNNTNMLVVSAYFIETAEAERCLHAFLDTSLEGGCHKERIDKTAPPTY